MEGGHEFAGGQVGLVEVGGGEVVELSAELADGGVGVEEGLGCGSAERDDDARAQDGELAEEEGRAGSHFGVCGRAVSGRATLDDVADIDLIARECHGGDHAGE